MTTSKVTLRIQEVAKKKIFRLLSRLTSGISEDENELQEKEASIQAALENTASLKEIALSLEEPDIAKVFETLTPELAQNKALYLLSKASDISEETLRTYDTAEDVNLKDPNIFDNLKRIAVALDVSVVYLIKPVVKREAFKLKIRELAQQQEPSLSLTQLSKKSNVDVSILCFYSTQSIDKQKLDEPQFHTNLTKISEALECTIEDLMDTNKADLPASKLRIEEVANDKNLTFEDLSLLTNTTPELIELIAKNPIDLEAFKWTGVWPIEPELTRVLDIIIDILDMRRKK